MSASVTRQQRRQMQRLADAVDAVVEGDRRFFERFPSRTYRVRLLSQPELRSLEILQRRPVSTTAAQAAFVAIKQITDGARLRVTVVGPSESVGEELTEAEARAVFEGYADLHPQVRQREADMLRAMRLPGGPLSDASNCGGGAD